MKKPLPPFQFNFIATLLIGLIMFANTKANGQCTSTLTLQPNGATGIDAPVASWSNSVNTNYANDPDLDADTWTINGAKVIYRGFLQFNLSSIPANAIVQQASLTLYNNPTTGNGYPAGSHSSLTMSNASWLQKVIAPWNENTITWNNQPAADPTNQAILPQSTSPHQDYIVDVKNLVQGMVASPATNYGFLLRMQTESYYGALVFASSDHADATKHPKLVITYSLPFVTSITASGATNICVGDSVLLTTSPTGAGYTYQWKNNGVNIPGANASTYYAKPYGNFTCLISNTCSGVLSNSIAVGVVSNYTVTIQPNGATGVDALVASWVNSVNTNYGNDPDLDADSWTINGDEVIFRGYIRFDLNNIPVNAVVQQASLSLYNNPTTANGYPPGSHSSLTNSNASWLQKVTAPWNENIITWNNQPTTDTTGKVALMQSTSPHQDYTVDVKNLIQGMVTNPATNYGLMLRSQTEIKYCALLFASSDHADAAKRPKLVISYTIPFAGAIAATGATTICAGNTVALSATPTGTGITYQWALNNVNISGATSASYSAATSGNYSCLIANGCASMLSNTINVIQNGAAPAIPGTVTGNVKPCPGDTAVIYSVTAAANVTTYNWAMPTGATLTAGQGTNTIKVNFTSNFVSGNITVTASNVCGTSAARTKSVSRNIPGTPSAIIGQTYSLCGGATASYSVNAVSTATTYVWTVPTGVTINSGQGTASVNLTFPASFVSGTVSVKAGNNCGFGGLRTLTVRGTPPTPGAINGASTACANQTNVAYSVAAIGGATAYNWGVPSGATILTGQGTNSITVKFGTATGTVRVRAQNACGYGSYSNLTVIINCREENQSEIGATNYLTVQVYPNPSNSFFNIVIASPDVSGETIAPENDFYTLTIRDVIGKTVAQWSKVVGNKNFEFGSELANGIYFAEIINDQQRKVIRLVKAND